MVCFATPDTKVARLRVRTREPETAHSRACDCALVGL